MTWLVIADDLSGAADCAIGFAAAGARTVVTLDANAGRDPGRDPGRDQGGHTCANTGGERDGNTGGNEDSDKGSHTGRDSDRDSDRDIGQAQVIAADVDSRRLAPAAAAARNLDAWRRLDGAQRRLYKKIDSTLRGNWAEETAALLPHAGLAIVAPAFPATGRTTRDGCMFINGEPLGDSDIWRLEGLRGRADMVALLAARQVRAVAVSLATVRAGADTLRHAIEALAQDGTQAVVCDAETEADIATLAQATSSLSTRAFWVGSGGLARVLAAVAPGTGPGATGAATGPATSTTGAGAVPPRRPGPVLALVGSLSGVSGRQAALLRQETGIDAIEIAPQTLRDGAGHAAWNAAQQDIARRLDHDCDLLLTIGRDDAFDPAEGPLLSTALAALVLPWFHRVGGLIATGGETARAMLAAADIATLVLQHEVEAGVPLSHTLEIPPRRVATKAGAFGSDAALWRAWQAMKAP